MAVQIQLRRGTAGAWTTANPILAEGEFGIDSSNNQFKIGDGITAWNSLPYGGLVGTVGLNNLPPNPTTGYALIYNGTALAWGQAGYAPDDDQTVLSVQVFGAG